MYKYILSIGFLGIASTCFGMHTTPNAVSQTVSLDDFSTTVSFKSKDSKIFHLPKAWLKNTPWATVACNSMKEGQNNLINLDTIKSDIFKHIVHALQLTCSSAQVGYDAKSKIETYTQQFLKIQQIDNLQSNEIIEILHMMEYANIDDVWLSVYAKKFVLKNKETEIEFDEHDTSRVHHWISHWYTIIAPTGDEIFNSTETITLKEFSDRFSLNDNIVKDKNSSFYFIDLSYCNLSTLDGLWDYVKNRYDIKPENILIIDLEGNKLSELPSQLLKDCIHLRKFNCNGNYLTTLAPHFFNNCVNILTINLSDNNLKNLDQNVFSNNQKLVNIDLDNNEWQTLNENVFANCPHIIDGKTIIKKLLENANAQKKRKHDDGNSTTTMTTSSTANTSNENYEPITKHLKKQNSREEE